MVPELLQGRRRKSNIGDDEAGGNEQEEEEEGGSENEDINCDEGGNDEEEIKPEVAEIKMELDVGQLNGSDRRRPSVIMFQRSAELSTVAGHVQTQRAGRDGERSPAYGDMAVSGDKHFSIWICRGRDEIQLLLAFLNQ